MKTITFKPEFEAKLKKLHVKRRFVRNLRDDCEREKTTVEDRVKYLNTIDNFHVFVKRAFDWEETSEGSIVWVLISAYI